MALRQHLMWLPPPLAHLVAQTLTPWVYLRLGRLSEVLHPSSAASHSSCPSRSPCLLLEECLSD